METHAKSGGAMAPGRRLNASRTQEGLGHSRIRNGRSRQPAQNCGKHSLPAASRPAFGVRMRCRPQQPRSPWPTSSARKNTAFCLGVATATARTRARSPSSYLGMTSSQLLFFSRRNNAVLICEGGRECEYLGNLFSSLGLFRKGFAKGPESVVFTQADADIAEFTYGPRSIIGGFRDRGFGLVGAFAQGGERWGVNTSSSGGLSTFAMAGGSKVSAAKTPSSAGFDRLANDRRIRRGRIARWHSNRAPIPRQYVSGGR